MLGLTQPTMYRKLAEHRIPRRKRGATNSMQVTEWYLRTEQRVSLASYERLALRRAWLDAGGRVEVAARLLGVSKSTVQRRVAALAAAAGAR